MSLFDPKSEQYGTILQIEKIIDETIVNDASRQDFLDYLFQAAQSNDISYEKFETVLQDIENYSPLYLYTKNTFLYQRLNRVLSECDMSSIHSMRYLIKSMSKQMLPLSRKTSREALQSGYDTLRVYRGISLAVADADFLKNNIGNHLISIPFMSTTESVGIAMMFCELNSPCISKQLIRTIFSIEVDTQENYSRPFASISQCSSFTEEDEILFHPGSVFQVLSVEYQSVSDNFLIVHLKLTSQRDEDKLRGSYLIEAGSHSMKSNYNILL